MDNEIEIVRDRKEILALAGLGLYRAELEEKLALYKTGDSKLRRNWSVEDLDIHLRRRISTSIVDNIYQRGPVVKNKKPRIKTDKDMILILSEDLNIELMAIKHLYNEVKESLKLSESKEDTRDHLSAQLYAHLDDLDLKIEASETERDQQKWYEIKMKAIDQMAKMKNLEEKQSVSNTTVHGNVNTQQNIDKQVVLAEQQALLSLMNKLLPQNKN